MGEKIKVDFLIVSRFKGRVIKQSSLYIQTKNRKYAEKRAYMMLTSNNSPSRNEIILIDSRE